MPGRPPRPRVANTFDHIVRDIQQSADPVTCRGAEQLPAAEKQSFVDAVARRNVSRVVERMRAQSQTLDGLVQNGRIAIVGAMYDIVTGEIEFLTEPETNLLRTPDPV